MRSHLSIFFDQSSLSKRSPMKNIFYKIIPKNKDIAPSFLLGTCHGPFEIPSEIIELMDKKYIQQFVLESKSSPFTGLKEKDFEEFQ